MLAIQIFSRVKTYADTAFAACIELFPALPFPPSGQS